MREITKARLGTVVLAVSSFGLIGTTAVALNTTDQTTAAPGAPGVGRVETCVLDAQSGCTITHGFGEKPTSVTVTNGGPTFAAVHPDSITATTYRVVFRQMNGGTFAAGTAGKFNAHYDFSEPAPPDTTAPDTTITTAPPLETENTDAAFTFTSTEAGTFECQFEDGPFEACESPAEYQVSEGEHHFAVRAKDAAGNTDATPAEHTWNRTAPPPPAVKPLMGASTWTNAEWPPFESAMGPSQARRTYESTIPASFAASKAGSAGDVAAGRHTFTSYKPPMTGAGALAVNAAEQAKVLTYLRSVPVGHPVTIVCYHEPEQEIARGDFTAPQWKDCVTKTGELVDQVNAEKGPDSKLRAGFCIMGPWTLDTRSPYDTFGLENWSAAQLATIDVVGIDPYKWNPGDPSMQQMLTGNDTGTTAGSDRSVMTKLGALGKPISLMEWGVTATNFSDANRAAFITGTYDWSKAWNADGNPATPLVESLLYFHINNLVTASDNRPTWEVLGSGQTLARDALAAAFADARS